MSNIYTNTNVNLIKQLRDRTSLGLADCKKALEQSNNDIEVAIDLLKQWGELKGKEKENRIATEGMIQSYSNNSGTIHGIVEVNCQSDFVAKGDDFKHFVNTVCRVLEQNGDLEFETERKELIAKTGENILVRRNETWSSGFNPFSLTLTYIHPGNKLASMVKVSTSDEKVTNSPEFIEFVNDIALQIAAMSPIVVSKDDISPELLDRQQKIFEAQLTVTKEDEDLHAASWPDEDKSNYKPIKKIPVQSWPKIIEGKFSKWRKDIVLLEQESIKDSKKTVDQVRQELSRKLGSDIDIYKFVRFSLGEGIVKKEENLADEVSKLINSSGDNTKVYKSDGKLI